MLVVRGLLVAIGGIAFVFLPGALISLLTRRDLRFQTSLLLWGMGLMLVTLFPALFLTSLLRLLIVGQRDLGGPLVYVMGLLASVLLAIFLEGGQYLFLRWRGIPAPELLNSGILIGLGVGLLTDVLHGMALIGVGFRLVFGDTSEPDLAAVASQAWPNLIVGLLALNVYRIALVALSAALGALLARALLRGRLRWLVLAMAISALAAWSYNAIGQALGSDSVVGSIVAMIYQGALGAVALLWLMRQSPEKPDQPQPKKRPAAAVETP